MASYVDDSGFQPTDPNDPWHREVHFRRLIAVQPARDNFVALIFSLLDQHKVEATLETCEAALKHFPNDPQILTLAAEALGGVYATRIAETTKRADFDYDLPGALGLVEQALQKAPNDIKGHMARTALLAKHRLAEKSYEGFRAVMGQATQLHGLARRAMADDIVQQATNPANADKIKAVFVHVAKCGGTSVLTSGAGIQSVAHRFFTDSAEECEKYENFLFLDTMEGTTIPLDVLSPYPRFTVIRNPFGFLHSYYRYLKSYDNYLMPDLELAERYEFLDFVRVIADRGDCWPWKKTLFFQLFSQPSGKLAVDWVCRLENMAEDLPAFGACYGLDLTPQVRRQSGKASELMSNYDDKTIALVKETWAREFELFGFDEQGGYREGDFLTGDVSAWKDRVRYDLAGDVLSLDGGAL